jgi:hypothetical protein
MLYTLRGLNGQILGQWENSHRSFVGKPEGNKLVGVGEIGTDENRCAKVWV